MQYSHIFQVRVCSSKIWKSEVLKGKDSYPPTPTKSFSFEPKMEMDFHSKFCCIYQTKLLNISQAKIPDATALPLHSEGHMGYSMWSVNHSRMLGFSSIMTLYVYCT